jgi:hypothetical protein
MSKKFRAKNIYDLSHIPVSEVKREDSVGRLSDYRKRLAREEEEARIAAGQKQIEQAETARLAELASPAARRIAAYWSQPLFEIQINGLDLSPVDLCGDYEIGPRDDKAETTAWNEFNANLTSQGCTIYRGGFQRLQMYLESLAYHRDVSLASVANWRTALVRLHSLSVFEPHELEGYRPPSATVEQPQQTQTEVNPLDELEALSLESRAGNLRGREIVNGLVGNEERASWFKFIEQFPHGTGHDLTHAEGLAIFNMMKHRGLDFRNPKHLRMVVVALCKMGELPAEKILSPQEQLDIFIEQADLSDIAVRREVNRRQRVINETAERKRLGV